jgi:hypothetical protein
MKSSGTSLGMSEARCRSMPPIEHDPCQPLLPVNDNEKRLFTRERSLAERRVGALQVDSLGAQRHERCCRCDSGGRPELDHVTVAVRLQRVPSASTAARAAWCAC